MPTYIVMLIYLSLINIETINSKLYTALYLVRNIYVNIGVTNLPINLPIINLLYTT